MNQVNYLLLGGLLLLQATSGWIGGDDPCGVSLRITQPIRWGESRRSQAVETLVATNTVSRAAQVEYEAGRSITMLPGFHAEPGSTFSARVKPCACNPAELEGNRLTLTAYPNPFVASTVIRYRLTEASPVNLTLLDEQGQTIAVLVSEASQERGLHEYTYHNPSLQEAVYLYSLRTKQGVITQRLVKGH